MPFGEELLLFDIVPEKKTPAILVIYYKSIDTKEIEKILETNKIKYKFKSNNISTKESSCIYEITLNKNNNFVSEISSIKGINEVTLLSQDGESQY